jgi:hypothetical protein
MCDLIASFVQTRIQFLKTTQNSFMEPQKISFPPTKLVRILMTLMVIVAIPLAMMGIFFLAIGISNGTVVAMEFPIFKRWEYIGKGMFMSVFGIGLATMGYQQLKKAKSKGQ